MNRIRFLLFLFSTLIFLIPITFGLQTFGINMDKFIFSEGANQSLEFFAQMFNSSYSETNIIDAHLDLSGITLFLEMNMSNPSTFPMTINTIKFIVYCSNHSEIKLGIGENSQPITLEPHSINKVPLTFSVVPEGVSHIYSHHFQFPLFIIELTLDIKNIEIETSIYGISMAITVKDTLKIPLYYEFINGI